ncbi:MAG TPA: hypothetical protein VFY93_10545 [Planctomycetota bacterium]|nr:hypothetical protein [Planctomycetota bacterium]
MPIVTLGPGDQLSVGADAAGGKTVSLLMVTQSPGLYPATQPANLFDVAIEALGLIGTPGTVIKSTITQLPNDIVDIAVETTKQ